MNRNLDWRWISIGTAIMFGLNLVAGLLLLPLLGGAPSADAAAALGGGRLLVAALVYSLSFSIGGYVVGACSSGRTVVEPGISAAIAVAIDLLVRRAFTLGNLLAGSLVPFFAGLLGGWLGERGGRGSVASPPVSVIRWVRPIS